MSHAMPLLPADVPRLCPIVEGVTFTVIHAGRAIRCLVEREAIEAALGARDGAAGWVAAVQRHREALYAAVHAKCRADPLLTVALLQAQDLRRPRGAGARA